MGIGTESFRENLDVFNNTMVIVSYYHQKRSSIGHNQMNRAKTLYFVCYTKCNIILISNNRMNYIKIVIINGV